jgi:hypothetical protein
MSTHWTVLPRKKDKKTNLYQRIPTFPVEVRPFLEQSRPVIFFELTGKGPAG